MNAATRFCQQWKHENNYQGLRGSMVIIAQRMLMTLAGLTLNRRAVGRIPSPLVRAIRIPFLMRYGTFGR